MRKMAAFVRLNAVGYIAFYPIAHLLNMVKAVQQRMAVYPHPHEKFVKRLIRIEDIEQCRCAADGGQSKSAHGGLCWFRSMLMPSSSLNMKALLY